MENEKLKWLLNNEYKLDVELFAPKVPYRKFACAEYQGAVMSDLQNRRGMLGDMGADKGFAILKARVPLAEIYRYSTTLGSRVIPCVWAMEHPVRNLY